jgi:hypothetical protein
MSKFTDPILRAVVLAASLCPFANAQPPCSIAALAKGCEAFGKDGTEESMKFPDGTRIPNPYVSALDPSNKVSPAQLKRRAQ